MDCQRWWDAQPDDLATDQPAVAAAALADFAASGLADLPRPGTGATWARFEQLIAVGRADLTLGRLVEAHVDAAAILIELGAPPIEPGQLWGVWAAEPPTAKVVAEPSSVDGWVLRGRKAWCSGAGSYTHALVTAHAEDGPRLFAVALADPGVTPVDGSWAGLALTGADTRSVDFRDVPAIPIGDPGNYVDRPGFWHGAVGVAAVWYGGAVGVAQALADKAAGGRLDDIGLAHLGAVDVAICGARASLRVAAARIDDDPSDRNGHAALVARRTRGVVEAAAGEVIDRVGRALGAAPLAMNRTHARRVADLAMYVRQSHADADLADLGRRIVETGPSWCEGSW